MDQLPPYRLPKTFTEIAGAVVALLWHNAVATLTRAQRDLTAEALRPNVNMSGESEGRRRPPR
jgi:hypothetical protein